MPDTESFAGTAAILSCIFSRKLPSLSGSFIPGDPRSADSLPFNSFETGMLTPFSINLKKLVSFSTLVATLPLTGNTPCPVLR